MWRLVLSAALCLAIVAVIRSFEPAAPAHLAYRDLGALESQFPLLVAIKVENTGGEVAEINSVTGVSSFNYLIAGPGDMSQVPDDFHWKVHLGNPDDKYVQPGETKIVPALLEWKTGDAALEMLAVVQMAFSVEYDDKQSVSSKPIVLVLGNTAEVQQGFVQGRIGFYEGHQKLREQLESLDGLRSDSAKLLAYKLSGDSI